MAYQTCDLLHAIYYYYFEILLLLLLLQTLSDITITITITLPSITITITINFVTISKKITSYTAINYFPYTFYNNKHHIISILRLLNTN